MEQILNIDEDDPIIDLTSPDLATCAASKAWEHVGAHDHHGINLPLFSLRSKNSAGIGEYTDLYPLIDWCEELHLSVIQLLPCNDPGHDTSPYNSLSALALNPLFLGLSSLESFDSTDSLKEIYRSLQKLNETKKVDYSAVRTGKRKFIREYLKLFANKIKNSRDYQEFAARQKWLDSYALFKVLKEKNQWSSWQTWGEDATPDENRFNLLLKENESEIELYKLAQYLCFDQFEKDKKYANSKKIYLKGDIPILISKESADVWYYRSFFYLDFSAGAPPDMYSEEGQAWGFPVYNWKELRAHDYDWWKQRLEFASHFYDIYRLDHIVGFFRIWIIAKGLKAKEGHFLPVNSATWVDHGEKILNALLENSEMLPIGEDLGIVPNRVKNCLTHLGICGTKVLRWERNWNTDKSFISPEHYPRLSMSTVSTHDSETIQLWWKTRLEEVSEFVIAQSWVYEPEITKEQHIEILRISHQSNSIFHINLLQEYLTVFPELSWPNPEDERINLPGTFNDENWTYRFKPTVEEIVSHKPLKELFHYCLAKELE